MEQARKARYMDRSNFIRDCIAKEIERWKADQKPPAKMDK
jgi:hypothetical protein